MYTKVMSHKFLLAPRQFTEPLSPFFWAVGSMRPPPPHTLFSFAEMTEKCGPLAFCFLVSAFPAIDYRWQWSKTRGLGPGWLQLHIFSFLVKSWLVGKVCTFHWDYVPCLKVRQWGLKHCSSEQREGGCFVLILTQGSRVSIEQLTIPTPPKHWDDRRDGFLLCSVSTIRSLGCKKDTNWSHSYRGQQWSVWGYSQNSGTIAEGWAAKFLRRHTVPDYN